VVEGYGGNVDVRGAVGQPAVEIGRDLYAGVVVDVPQGSDDVRVSGPVEGGCQVDRSA
jgi:hypothetical protein